MARITCDSENSLNHLFTVKDNDGAAIDLTDYAVSLVLTSRDDVVTFTEGDGLTVDDPTAGTVLMSWAAGDAPPEGQYRGQMIIEKTGVRFTSRTFPTVVIN